MTLDDQYVYIYDCENRLIEVRQNGGTIAEYKYDFAGRRVQKTVDGVQTTVKYLYDGDQIIQEYRDGYGRWKTYYYGPGIDELIRMIGWENPGEPGLSYYYDGLGSVVALADYMGNIVEKYSYDVFGKPTIRNAQGAILTTSAVGNRFMFTGREYDVETGNYYYRARYYKPSIGRFLQPDPAAMHLIRLAVAKINPNTIGRLFVNNQSIKDFLKKNPIGRFLDIEPTSRLSQMFLNGGPEEGYYIDLNLYIYAGNNPVLCIDPYGLAYKMSWKAPTGAICVGFGTLMAWKGMLWAGGLTVLAGVILEGWELLDYTHQLQHDKELRKNKDMQKDLDDDPLQMEGRPNDPCRSSP